MSSTKGSNLRIFQAVTVMLWVYMVGVWAYETYAYKHNEYYRIMVEKREVLAQINSLADNTDDKKREEILRQNDGARN